MTSVVPIHYADRYDEFRFVTFEIDWDGKMTPQSNGGQRSLPYNEEYRYELLGVFYERNEALYGRVKDQFLNPNQR